MVCGRKLPLFAGFNFEFFLTESLILLSPSQDGWL